METSPLLARRVIPRKERLQKVLVVLLVTAVVVSGSWIFVGNPLDCGWRCIIALGSVACLGLITCAVIWFNKEERGSTKEENRAVRRRIEDDRRERSWTSRIGYNTRRFLGGTVVLLGALFVVAGLGVLALQVIAYLKAGSWSSVSVLSIVAPYWPWLRNPESWFGLHEIVSASLKLAPLSLALIVIGWLVAGFGSGLKERATRKIRD